MAIRAFNMNSWEALISRLTGSRVCDTSRLIMRPQRGRRIINNEIWSGLDNWNLRSFCNLGFLPIVLFSRRQVVLALKMIWRALLSLTTRAPLVWRTSRYRNPPNLTSIISRSLTYGKLPCFIVREVWHVTIYTTTILYISHLKNTPIIFTQ